MSESLTFMHKLRQGLSGLLGGAAEPVAATAQGLPVNLGGYEFARTSPGAAARLYGVDRALVWVVVALLMWGMVMVYSASIAMPDNPRFARYAQTHFLTRHIISLVLGTAVALLAFQIPMETWEKWARPMFVMALVLLALVLIPFIGKGVNGARRWIGFGGLNLQPSEVMKLMMVIYAADFTVRKQQYMHSLSKGFFPVAAAVGVCGGLLMLQPDLGSAILFAGVWFVLALLAGISVQLIGVVFAGGLGAVTLAYMFYENGRNRIDAFLGGGTAFDQVDLASRTLLSGGWTGTGIWLGKRKMALPEAHTDYIFSVIGEEFGLLRPFGFIQPDELQGGHAGCPGLRFSRRGRVLGGSRGGQTGRWSRRSCERVP